MENKNKYLTIADEINQQAQATSLFQFSLENLSDLKKNINLIEKMNTML